MNDRGRAAGAEGSRPRRGSERRDTPPGRGHPALLRAGGVRDYWIVNLVDRVVEVYRDPRPDETAPYGWSYGAVERLRPPATITPLAFAAGRITVADLLV